MSPKKLAVIIVAAIIIVAAVSVVLLTQGPADSKVQRTYIAQGGSETMYDLGLKWASDYTDANPLTTINVSRGGTSTGITGMLNGTLDIADASNQMTADQLATARSEGKNVTELKVALDGVAILVNPNNPVTSLDLEQLRGLYNGTITNWNMVGGNDQTVQIYGRNNTSGTYSFFQQHVLNNENYSSNMSEYDNYDLMIPDIMSHGGAVGYVGIGFATNYPDVKIVALKVNSTSLEYLPTKQNVLSGVYPLWRYLYLYTTETLSDGMLNYLKWVVSPSGGQTVTQEMGFYSIPDNISADDLQKLGG